MEAVQFSAVVSRHFSTKNRSFHCDSKKMAGKSTEFVPAWTWNGSGSSARLSSRNLFTVSSKRNTTLQLYPPFYPFLILFADVYSQREIWSWINSKNVSLRREYKRSLVRAEMFGQLTSGLEAAWTKLKGEGSVASLFNFCVFCMNSKNTNKGIIFTRWGVFKVLVIYKIFVLGKQT